MCKTTENGILFLNLNSDKHGQKSWDKFTFVALFHERAKQTVTREFIYTWSAPPLTYNVGHMYTLFLQSFNIV